MGWVGEGISGLLLGSHCLASYGAGLALCLVLTSGATTAAAVSYSQMPNKHEWQYFLQRGSDFQKNFWHEHRQREIQFSDWSWSWRILWLKSCGLSKEPHCIKILAQGFRDRAMVVRAEAITQLGRRFRGSGNSGMLAQLNAAAKVPRNFRHQQPMFIHHNIKRAVAMIRGVRD